MVNETVNMTCTEVLDIISEFLLFQQFILELVLFCLEILQMVDHVSFLRM